MKSNYFVIVLGAILVLVSGGLVKGGSDVVTLGMLDPSLKSAEGSSVDAFTIKENQIEFEQPGVDKYDKFFKEVAIVSGTVTELRYVLEQVNNGKLTVMEAKPVIDFGRTSLPELKKKIPSLIEEAKSFKPSEDFTGLNKRKIPAVASGLTKSIDSLNSAAKEIPTIMEQLDALASK